MRFNVYCMRDVKTGYLTPTFELNEGVARRNFAFAVTNKDSLFYANPEDFELYCIGSFDTESGSLVGLNEPQFMLSAASLIRKEEE